MRNYLISSAAAVAIIVSSGAALAQSATATATSDLNIRSGPGPQYPVVGVIPQDNQAGLGGCIEGSKWCEVSYNGTQGWAYSDYLVAAFDGADVVVAERRGDIGVPVATYDNDGAVTSAVGAAGGAVAGALIAGPIGAAVGGIAGATAGGLTDAAFSPPPAEVRTYIRDNRVEPVYLEGEVVVGAGVPENVQVYEVPDYDYRYAYVNGQPVVIEPGERRIVYVIRD